IPLALELAAARVRALPVEQIEARLQDRFRLLTGGSRTALPRQQTLRALIDWSYDLLSESEKKLLHRLSVFVGGWALEAAEKVGAGGEIVDWEALDLLTSLVDKSLVFYEQHKGPGRYRLLETVRQYSQERLAASAETETVRQKHSAFFLNLAEEAQRQLRGPEQARWLEMLETEHDNLRAALRWYLETQQEEAGLRLAVALGWFWYVAGSYWSEGRKWLSEALEKGQTAPPSLQAKALLEAARLARHQYDLAGASRLYEQSLSLWREIGDQTGISHALNGLAAVAMEQMDYASASTLLEQSLELDRQLGDRRGMAVCLANLGLVAKGQEDYARARALFEESLVLKRQLGEETSIADTLYNLGDTLCCQGEYTLARSVLEESLAIYQRLGNRWGIALAFNSLATIALSVGEEATAQQLYTESLALFEALENPEGMGEVLCNIARLACRRGDYEKSRRRLARALDQYRFIGNKVGLIGCLEAWGTVAAGQQQADRAARLLGAAERQREDIGVGLPLSAREEYARNQAIVREALGEAAFAAAWEEGRAMTLEQAIAYALEEEKH
ncbi:MAG TPA: tetratricopeptide repeat protein, partial [Chthonomonadaceae bacterium]|nr:tetratricopeptide repeat protein [Chthonomonadaceae bacterium]